MTPPAQLQRMSFIDRWVRSIIPQSTRARLRRNATINRLLALRYGGPRHKPHPHAPYEIHFDGYRNIGWAAGNLADIEGLEMAYARDLIQRRTCRCAWDIGANVGFWSLFLAGIEPPIEKIYAFEPDSTNLKYLRLNWEKNHLDRLLIREIGLSDKSGSATFFADELTGSTGSLERGRDFIGENYGQARREVTIQLSTVDAECDGGLSPPDFIKIDVEGHELNVLKGAEQTLRKYHPSLILEVTQRPDEVGVFLRSMGYQLLDPHSGKTLENPQFATAAVWKE